MFCKKGVFINLQVLQNFEEHLFFYNTSGGCFCRMKLFSQKSFITDSDKYTNYASAVYIEAVFHKADVPQNNFFEKLYKINWITQAVEAFFIEL